MNPPAGPPIAQITSRFVDLVCERLAASKRVRRRLPEWGRVHIDRALPFLSLYRRPPSRKDPGTDRLVTTEAAYLIASGSRRLHGDLSELVRKIADTLSRQFGAFIILEVWAAPAEESLKGAEADSRPAFRIVSSRDERLDPIVEAFDRALSSIKLRKLRPEVRVVRTRDVHPRRLPPILPAETARALKCVVVGLEVSPTYRDASGEQLYPLQLRQLRRGLSRALRRTFFEFSRSYTLHRPRHYHMLGRRAVVKAVWQVDRQLADVAARFDLLLQATPVNARLAWSEFQRDRFERAPTFRYRPIPVDPMILKRRLFAIPIERVEDPTLADLFRQKQDELDRQITMLVDLNTKRFLHGSLQLHGGVGANLRRLAVELLRRLPPRARDETGRGYLDAEAFATRAEREIAYYRERWPEVDARVQIRDDVNAGLMVSSGSLLVGRHTRIPSTRVEALLNHEIGTHVLTYYNGRAQPFRQLCTGLAGYESLQEGLAVLAEYLVGGLSRPRLRLLAARVMAVHRLSQGASFVDCYRELVHEYDLPQQTAFTVTMRVFRGGGLTKDAAYLSGLNKLLEYLSDGGKLETLFVGKIAAEHVPLIEELTWRRVLRNPPLTPRYMTQPDAVTRLARVRGYASALDLIEREYQ